jgi:outer membrane protein assembly factor BamB
MRTRTALALGGLLALLGGLVVLGLGPSAAGGSLNEAWVSDTARDNEVNHHAVGVGPAGDVIVAPVAEVPNSDAPITNTSCALVRLAPADGAVVWRAGVPADACFTHALTRPAITDVDGDGALEVVAATTEDALVAFDAGTGAEEWRVPLSTYGYGPPTVANVTPAPGPEVVASDIDGGVVVARGNGSVAWRFDANATDWAGPVVWDAPVVDDVDGDGRPEVVVGSNRGLLALTHEGTVAWRHNGSAATVAVDPADDGPATLFASGPGAVRAHDGATGEREWSRPLQGARVRAAADGDDDGATELYVGRVGARVLALDAASGETAWTTTVADDEDVGVPPPVLADVTGDGRPEVVAVTNGGVVAVLDAATGAELAAYERSVPIWTVPTPADVDDDGRAEVLVRYGDGRVVALEYAS